MGRLGAAFAVIALVGGTIAYACADGGEGPGSWNPQQSSAILSPANDTRSNLLLLLADGHGTAVADSTTMAKGIVPIEFGYSILVARLAPPAPEGGTGNDYSAAYHQQMAEYGLTESNRYFGYDSNNIGLCHTNRRGAEQFATALAAEKGLPANEKAVLAAARDALGKACDQANELRFELGGITSPLGRSYAHYVDGARLFYAEDFVAAQQEFSAARGAPSTWLADVAAYMQFRTALAAATKASVDRWGDMAEPDKRDQHAIDQAEALRRQYLKEYPGGRYAASARGLERRVAWLRGDRRALGAAYSVLVGGAAARHGNDPNLSLIEEIDVKLLPDGDAPGVTDPTLLAVVDLMRLRQDGRDEDYTMEYRGAKLEQAELEAQRPHFKSEPALFDYLLAVEAFYQRKQPREVLQLIPDAAQQPRFSYVQFSRQMLRGFALEAVKDRNARGFWLSLLPGATQPYQREAVELALANHDANSGKVDRLFADGSPLRHPLIRQKLLEDSAAPALLRQQARTAPTVHEREVSLYLLLAGELHHGLYADFIKDLQLVSTRKSAEEANYYGWDVGSYDPQYGEELGSPPLEVFAAGGSNDLAPCPDIRATAASLTGNPAASRPRLCLAEFFRLKGFDRWSETYDAQYNRVTRMRGFPGKPVERMDIYRSVIAAPTASADDKAFALNRAIRCYEPTGYSSCGVADVPLATRKAWFQRLKGQYANSRWAKELKYYW